jgi:hypothetical protein
MTPVHRCGTEATQAVRSRNYETPRSTKLTAQLWQRKPPGGSQPSEGSTGTSFESASGYIAPVNNIAPDHDANMKQRTLA